MEKFDVRILIVSVLLLAGCRKAEEVAPVDLGYGYYPTTVGSWVEYQVDSLWRDDRFNIRDSVSYRLRQVIESTYTNPEGRLAWRVHRMVLDSAGNWVVRDVWNTTVNGIAAELSEENERRQKLAFPVRFGRTWDINVYNTGPELSVSYNDVDLPWAVNGMSFDSTAQVRQTVQANPIVRRDFEERYAKGVGMVYKNWVETNTQVNGTQGFYFTMVAVAYGTE